VATAVVAAASGAQAAFPASAQAQTARAAQTASTIAGPRRAGPARAGTRKTAVGVLDGAAQPITLASTRHHTPRHIARRMLTRKGWSSDYQFPYLNKLWDRESGWNVYAMNPYSGAYGIPQAVPGSKMSSAGADWPDSARTQIRWGLRYIRGRYNSPRQAWLHEVADGWY